MCTYTYAHRRSRTAEVPGISKSSADTHAPFGWTVIRTESGFRVYKRDIPATAEHFAADLAPFTHPTRKAALEAGRRGHYAYRHLEPATT